MDRLLCSCATHVYPEGQGVKKDLQDFNITKKPLKVLANGNINGINTSYFNSSLFQTKEIVNLRKNLGFNEQDVVFVFVGPVRAPQKKTNEKHVTSFQFVHCFVLMTLGSTKCQQSHLF